MRRILPTIGLTVGTVLGMAMGVMALEVRADQPRPHDPSWSAPGNQAAKTNPLAGRRETAAGGQKLYRQRCSACHGDDGGGTRRAPDLTAPEVQAQTAGALFWKISSGNTRSGMPSFSFLPELQRWQLVLYLQSLAAAASGSHARVPCVELRRAKVTSDATRSDPPGLAHRAP